MSFIVSLNFIVLAGLFHRSPKDMARSPRAYSADRRIGGLAKTEIRHQRGGAYEREIYINVVYQPYFLVTHRHLFRDISNRIS